jgi:hypothetical protein
MATRSRAETIQRASWPAIARQLATNAKRTTTLRRFFGEFKVDDLVFTYIGNGNPYPNDPNLRKAEHQLFRDWARKEKVTILAEASERTEDVVILILDMGDTITECKRFGEVFSTYTGLAASAQAFRLARQMNDSTCEMVVG